ncbi:hypothetical protein CAPTEDRAFT_208550 [Capitella teleta]|uniref:Uncharacterized protein n=1 Tax=Capitella teleta TaxID=283909 RepID=R7TSG8_CAPTE|nr:hypothetical protein CAPTEDRAFT_208550 [Capitella teleta]|eukprot:ELT93975.1 hypothetical protein CAPTEDRAFT_208550 [Capitella teleta]
MSKGGEKEEGYGLMVYGLQKKEGRTNEEIIGDVLQVLGRKEEFGSVEGRAGSGKEQEGREEEAEGEGEGGGRKIRGGELSGRNRDGSGRELKVVFKNKCEGVNVVENKESMAMIQKVTERVRMKDMMLIVGGSDFNGHNYLGFGWS